MKTRFLVISTVLVLALVLTIGGQAALAARADNVYIHMEDLCGDPAAATGITTSMRATMNDHLYWDIRHTVGGETDVDFFFSEERGLHASNGPYLEIHSFSGMGMSSSGSIDLEEEEGENMLKPAAALAEEVPAGETRKKTYALADFYDYYTIQSQIRLPSPNNVVRWALESEEEEQFVNDYFRFPVLPDHMVEVKVEKNPLGGVSDVSINTVSETDFSLGAVSAYTDHGYYFSFSRFNSMTPLDVSHIKDGYGIYVVPLAENSAGVQRIPEDRDPIELAVPLPEEIDLSGLAASHDQTELYVLYGKDGTQYLEVYALPDMEKTQTIELPKQYRDGGTVQMVEIMVDETGILLNGGACMTFLAPDADGQLAVQTIGDYQTALDEYGTFYTWNGLDYSWNGTYLAITYPYDFYESCQYYLLVFGKDGLAYTGRLGLSLNDLDAGTDADRYHYKYDYRVRFDSVNPYDDENYLSVNWQ